jgi:hypothetical protein
MQCFSIVYRKKRTKIFLRLLRRENWIKVSICKINQIISQMTQSKVYHKGGISEFFLKKKNKKIGFFLFHFILIWEGRVNEKKNIKM